MQPEQVPPGQPQLLIWQRETLLSRSQLVRLAQLLTELAAALVNKQPLRWGEGNRLQWTRLLRKAGVVLLTRTQLRRQRHEPKRGASAVVLGYFGAPIQRHAELYILDVQTRLIRRPLTPAEGARGEATGNPGRR